MNFFMKKLILFLLLVGYTSVAAQQYVPFPKENVEWSIVQCSYPAEFQMAKSYTVYNYHLGTDSIYNNLLYKTLLIDSVVCGLIREVDKKVYIVLTSSLYGIKPYKKLKDCYFSTKTIYGAEYLLYDFNVREGETVNSGIYQYQITKIDSVKIKNAYRKRYFLSNADILIEGIGSIKNDILYYLKPVPMCSDIISYSDLSCFSQDAETIYKNPFFKDCGSHYKWNEFDYLKTSTQWYYGERNDIWPPHQAYLDDYYSVKIIGDTVVNGKNCKVMQHLHDRPMCFGYDTQVAVFQSNDTVYFFNTESQTFSTLYVYGAIKGDFWEVNYPLGKSKVTVDSISSINLFNQTLKVQFVTYKYDDNVYLDQKSTIIEGIGDRTYFFMSNGFSVPSCDMSVLYDGLRCYIHPDYGTYHVPGTLDCAYVTDIPKNTSKLLKINLNSLGILSLEGDLTTESCTFELIDLKGLVILKTTVNASQNSISLSRFNKGLYLYRISKDGTLLKTGKFNL